MRYAPIIYPVALTAMATEPDAATFLAYMRSGEARPIFLALGSRVLGDRWP
jgi:molybdate transport system substrate-binding protein